jgi:limonene-1,2-epoxide hydrolase
MVLPNTPVRRPFITTPWSAEMISGSSKATFLASLLSTAAALSGCSTAATAPEPQQKQSVARVLEAYAGAMKTGDYSNVRFTSDVTFSGPLISGAIVGEAQVTAFLLKVSQGVKDVRVKRHVIDGEFACVIADLETKEGDVVAFCEFFRVVDGRIAEIRPYFDPRPLIR